MTIEAIEAMTLRDTLREAVIWLSRATGIGYRRYPPLIGREIDPRYAEELNARSDKLCRDVEQLEQELRKIGFRIPSRSGHAH